MVQIVKPVVYCIEFNYSLSKNEWCFNLVIVQVTSQMYVFDEMFLGQGRSFSSKNLGEVDRQRGLL